MLTWENNLTLLPYLAAFNTYIVAHGLKQKTLHISLNFYPTTSEPSENDFPA